MSEASDDIKAALAEALGTPNWTFESLRIHLESVINLHNQRYDERDKTREDSLGTAMTAAEKAVNAALAAAEKAVTKAETASEKRFDAQNEFREQLKDQAATFMPRTEAEFQLKAILDKAEGAIKMASIAAARGQGRGDMVGWAFGGLGLLAAFLSILLR